MQYKKKKKKKRDNKYYDVSWFWIKWLRLVHGNAKLQYAIDVKCTYYMRVCFVGGMESSN